jgi:hypothetical protein
MDELCTTDYSNGLIGAGANLGLFVVLEEFHLTQPLLRFFLRLVRPAKVPFAILGENLIATCNFLDHRSSSRNAASVCIPFSS